MRAITLSVLLLSLLLPASSAMADDTSAPTTEEPSTDKAVKKAEREALRQARLAAAIEDYESRYSTWHLNPGARPFHLRLSAELGFVGVVSHTIQFGQEGSKIDYLEEGGQDNLFPFARLSVDAELFHHLVITFLYQPLDVRSTSVLQRDIRIDDTVFAEGSGMDMRYGFSFYRLSIGGDFLPHPERELLLAFSAQIRNATIDFTSADGEQRTTNRNIGFVPIMKARFRWTFDKDWFIGAEVDGWYAAGRVVSGSSNDFDGAILDASIRAGAVLRPVGDVFLNLRYLGGGARGTDETPEQGDGYTNNWLHTMVLSLGVQVR